MKMWSSLLPYSKMLTRTFARALGLYTGTGFASFASQIEDPVTIRYCDLPYFPKELQTPMHVGEFVMGRVRGKPIICARGKMFLLDGVPAQLIALQSGCFICWAAGRWFIPTRQAPSIRRTSQVILFFCVITST